MVEREKLEKFLKHFKLKIKKPTNRDIDGLLTINVLRAGEFPSNVVIISNGEKPDK